MYIYRFEKEGIQKLTGDYSQNNRHECFAEIFRYILVNKNDEVKYKEMEDLIPMTLEYIENGFLSGDELCDLDILNDITDKYWEVYNPPQKKEGCMIE